MTISTAAAGGQPRSASAAHSCAGAGQQRNGHAGGRGNDHPAGAQRLLASVGAGCRHRPARRGGAVGRPEACDQRSRTDLAVEVADVGDQRRDELRHPPADALHGRPGRSGESQLRDAAGERAGPRHGGVQARRDQRDVEVVGVDGVDAGRQRGDQAFEDPAPHALAHQGSEPLGPADGEDRTDAVEVGAPGAGGADDGAYVLGERRRRDAQQGGLRRPHRDGSLALQRRQVQPRPRGVRTDDPVVDAELCQQRGDGASARGEALGADVDGESAHVLRSHASAGRGLGLEHEGAKANVHGFAGGDQAGDAAADDDHVVGRGVRRRRIRGRSRS